MDRPIITSFSFEIYFWPALNALADMGLRPHIEVSAKVAKEYQLAVPNINISQAAVADRRVENNRLKFTTSFSGQAVEMDIHLSEIKTVHGVRDASGYVVFPMPQPVFAIVGDEDGEEYVRLQEKAYPYDELDEFVETPVPDGNGKPAKKGTVIQGQFGKKK